jgi:hypothetical protein
MSILDDLSKVNYGKGIAEALMQIATDQKRKAVAEEINSAIGSAMRSGSTDADGNPVIGANLSLEVLKRIPSMLNATGGEFTPEVKESMTLSDMLMRPNVALSDIQYKKRLGEQSKASADRMVKEDQNRNPSPLTTQQVTYLMAELGTDQESVSQSVTGTFQTIQPYKGLIAENLNSFVDPAKGIDYWGLANKVIQDKFDESGTKGTLSNEAKNVFARKLAAEMMATVYSKSEQEEQRRWERGIKTTQAEAEMELRRQALLMKVRESLVESWDDESSIMLRNEVYQSMADRLDKDIDELSYAEKQQAKESWIEERYRYITSEANKNATNRNDPNGLR